MKVSVVGLGKLGLCTSACFASRGHDVIGVEKNRYFIDELNAGRCPIDEAGLEELLSGSRERLEVTSDLGDAVGRSDITLIIVPTPSGSSGKFSNEYVERVLRGIGPMLKSKSDFHIVDVVSTVMPGSCEKVFKPVLEELSGKICGRDFGLVYNPEFIALGSVIRDFLNPDIVLIGASDNHSAELVKELYVSTCRSNPYIASMSLVNAEITKLSLNCFVTTKISFANELASICERVPGADVDEVTTAIGSDSRVGGKYLTGGLGFGGTCFPRDNLAFQAFAKETGYEAKLSGATVAVNESVVDRLFSLITARVPKAGRTALLGLSYKPGTGIIEKSQSIMLAGKLAEAGYQVAVYDPKALKQSAEFLGKSVSCCNNPYDCVKDADAVVLLTRWPEFESLDWDKIESGIRKGAVLLDCWRQVKAKRFAKFTYAGLGLGSAKDLEAPG